MTGFPFPYHQSAILPLYYTFILFTTKFPIDWYMICEDRMNKKWFFSPPKIRIDAIRGCHEWHRKKWCENWGGPDWDVLPKSIRIGRGRDFYGSKEHPLSFKTRYDRNGMAIERERYCIFKFRFAFFELIKSALSRRSYIIIKIILFCSHKQNSFKHILRIHFGNDRYFESDM